MLQRRIEEVSLNAWPALRQILFDGWILRFSRGYTKRANSVNALFTSSMDVHEKIEICESFYTERGLPTIFRITPFCSPPELDQALESRGYEKISLTLVLHLDLEGCELPPAAPGQLHEEPLDDWLARFCQLKSSPLEEHQTHREILQAIPSTRYPASLMAGGQAVACGLGVLERDLFGLFDIVTAPRHRNKGHGTRLVSAMLRWARAHGAKHAYLGVEAGNTPARRLYAKPGFQETYRYWYRVCTAEHEA